MGRGGAGGRRRCVEEDGSGGGDASGKVTAVAHLGRWRVGLAQAYLDPE
jgi:hypothetical protein